MKRTSVFTLNGQDITLEDTHTIARGARIKIGSAVKKKILASRRLVDKLAQNKHPYYGINTGFGYLANQKIDKGDLKELQRNILTSHAAGWGEPLSIAETRLGMALRLNVLIKGYTGVRYELCQKILELIDAEIYPVIPSHGSVGASGDLAPLAHLALPLIGKGKVFYRNKIIEAEEALKCAKIDPIELAAKEGLSLINGTQIMLSIGALSLHKAMKLLEVTELVTALSYEGFLGDPRALDSKLHSVRRQTGQITSAKRILSHLSGSSLHSKAIKRTRVQDPYSLRCAPQVHGASRDSLGYSKGIIERELNAVTDNPLVFAAEEDVISGGNFHGQPLAMALDIAAIAVSELSNISERRLELLVNPTMNGLTAFLSPNPGVDSGFMAAQYLSGSLVNENKALANPAVTDSIPANVGVEDHVSMGMWSARKFRSIVENTLTVLSVEMLAAAQAITLRKNKKLGKGTKTLYDRIRDNIDSWDDNGTILSDDITMARGLLEEVLDEI